MSDLESAWRIRPAGETHQGKRVSLPLLKRAIEEERIGELDEVLGPGEREWRTLADHHTISDWLPRDPPHSPKEEEDAETDMTPMIDVTFQLIIFFMITATFTIQKTLDLPSSRPDQAGASQTLEELQEERIVVVLKADGSITVDGTPTDSEGVIAAIQEANRNKRSAELILDVEDQSSHESVVRLLDAAGAARIEKVLFASRAGS